MNLGQVDKFLEEECDTIIYNDSLEMRYYFLTFKRTDILKDIKNMAIQMRELDYLKDKKPILYSKIVEKFSLNDATDFANLDDENLVSYLYDFDHLLGKKFPYHDQVDELKTCDKYIKYMEALCEQEQANKLS